MEINSFIEQFADSLSDPEGACLTVETDFKGLASWDSLAILTVTDMVDMEFEVLLKKTDFHACTTLGELYQLILAKR